MLALPAASEWYIQATSTFIELCKLMQVSGDILPHVYALQFDSDESWRSLRKSEVTLDDWLAALPAYLVPISLSNVNGSSNLWFAYLSTKLLICRLAVKATLKDVTTSLEARQYRLSALREASCEVIDFVTPLKDTQLQKFWLSYTSYLLVTAATVLLRCTIECGDITTKKTCITKLVAFRDQLRKASTESG